MGKERVFGKKDSEESLKNGFSKEDPNSGISWEEWTQKRKDLHEKSKQEKLEKEKTFPKHGNEESLKDGFKTESPTSGISWKEWKQKKKELHKKWKQEKVLKKQQKALKEEKKKSNSSQNEHSSKGINYTVSIAVPGVIMNNAQTPELKAYLAGQIARAAAIFNVNEIVVYSESGLENLDDEFLKLKKKNGCTQLIRILQYLECPQYLRKYYFPIHKDLEYAGLVNPLDLPYHLRVEDESEYREGIVLNKPVKEGKGSYVYIGLKKTAVIDKILQTNVRVTVQLDKEQSSKKHLKGKAVSPKMPTKKNGTYWGYNVRLASGLKNVFSECPYKEGYDLTIGTSDKGQLIDDVTIPRFKHLLIVFGGLKGIEAALEGDESIKASDPSQLFQYYLNTCPSQGCRTIRTEEAILITLSALKPGITKAFNVL